MDRRAGPFDERETLDGDARIARARAIARDTIRICHEVSPFYRARLEEAGVAVKEDSFEFEHLSRLPVTTKKEAQQALAGLGTFPLQEARRIYVSPGPHFYASQRRSDPPAERGNTPLALAFHAMGFQPGDIVLNAFNYHLSPGGFGLDEQLGAAGCAVVPAGPGNSEIQVEVLAKLPVTGYVGTPTFLGLLCDKATEIGIEPRDQWHLEVAFVTAEKLTEEMRADLEARTGAVVRQVYGSADGLLPAYECWANTGMHLHPDMVTEILDPDTRAPVPTGQPGEVVATLPNPNRPLLRFANGDLVVLRDDPCPCGRTGARIARVAGRVDQATKVRGMFVYPEQIAQVLGRHPEVRRWQAVVTREGNDRLLIMLEGQAPQGIEDDLRALIRVRAEVEEVPAGTIPDGAKLLDDRRGYE